MIFTDAKGRPFPKPEPIADGADIETKIQWLRDMAAWRDARADCSNAAFVDQFRKSLRK